MQQAAAMPAGSEGLIVLPYLLGEKTPLLDPHARGVFLGLTLYHTRLHLYRAALESIAFGFRHHVDVLAESGAAAAARGDERGRGAQSAVATDRSGCARSAGGLFAR
jgi:sugar (pentulose or hexulose) kinase